MKIYRAGLAALILINFNGEHKKRIYENGMEVTWQFKNDRIYFTMSAPTDGWVAIGFNAQSDITGAYLIMGNVKKNKPKVVEYYTRSPGKYKSISELGGEVEVNNINGNENKENTKLQFSLPIKSSCQYKRDLTKGKKYFLLIAYSRSDDFQHHSMMRTSLKIEL
jgi:calcineurin-like phosphoesterase family protein